MQKYTEIRNNNKEIPQLHKGKLQIEKNQFHRQYNNEPTKRVKRYKLVYGTK